MVVTQTRTSFDQWGSQLNMEYNVKLICKRVYMLMPTVLAAPAFGARFTEDRGESVTYFIFLHHFWKLMHLCKYKMSRVSVCMWVLEYLFNEWVMDLGCVGLKENPNASNSLLLSKCIKESARFNVPSDGYKLYKCLRKVQHVEIRDLTQVYFKEEEENRPKAEMHII